MLWQGQQACEGVADPAVALAGDLLEPSPVRDDDAAALLRNQPLGLEGAQHRADGGALHPQQFGQIGMGQGQEILVDPVPGAQDPVAAAGLDRVNGIAGDGLEGLSQQGLTVAEHQPLHLGTGAHHLLHPVNGNPGGGAGHLDLVAPERLARDNGADQPEQPLAPEGGHLDKLALVHDVDQAHDGIMREVGVADRISGLIEDRAFGQVYHIQVRLQAGQILRLQGGEKPVAAVMGLRRWINHGSLRVHLEARQYEDPKAGATTQVKITGKIQSLGAVRVIDDQRRVEVLDRRGCTEALGNPLPPSVRVHALRGLAALPQVHAPSGLVRSVQVVFADEPWRFSELRGGALIGPLHILRGEALGQGKAHDSRDHHQLLDRW